MKDLKPILLAFLILFAAFGIAYYSGLGNGKFKSPFQAKSQTAVKTEAECLLEITAQDDMMTPGIKKDQKVNFTRCIDDKANIEPETIIVIEKSGKTAIARIKQRIESKDSISYQASFDKNPEEMFEVKQNAILGVAK